MRTTYLSSVLGIIFSLIFTSSQVNAAYDPSETVFNFQKKMAERGVTISQFKLGLMFETGSGTTKNIESAIDWHKKAASKGYKPAINRLTYIEIQQDGFREKHRSWLKSLKVDARFNEGESLFLLGQMFSKGMGVSKSLTKSLKLLRKAAAANIPGSEAEINRVEAEITELQKLHLTQQQAALIKEKARLATLRQQKAKQAVNVAAKPTVTSAFIAQPQATSKAITNPAYSRQSYNRKSKSTTNSTTHTAKPLISVNANPVYKPANNTQKSQSSIHQATKNNHPMDMICTGHNFFSSGCR